MPFKIGGGCRCDSSCAALCEFFETHVISALIENVRTYVAEFIDPDTDWFLLTDVDPTAPDCCGEWSCEHNLSKLAQVGCCGFKFCWVHFCNFECYPVAASSECECGEANLLTGCMSTHIELSYNHDGSDADCDADGTWKLRIACHLGATDGTGAEAGELIRGVIFEEDGITLAELIDTSPLFSREFNIPHPVEPATDYDLGTAYCGGRPDTQGTFKFRFVDDPGPSPGDLCETITAAIAENCSDLRIDPVFLQSCNCGGQFGANDGQNPGSVGLLHISGFSDHECDNGVSILLANMNGGWGGFFTTVDGSSWSGVGFLGDEEDIGDPGELVYTKYDGVDLEVSAWCWKLTCVVNCSYSACGTNADGSTLDGGGITLFIQWYNHLLDRWNHVDDAPPWGGNLFLGAMDSRCASGTCGGSVCGTNEVDLDADGLGCEGAGEGSESFTLSGTHSWEAQATEVTAVCWGGGASGGSGGGITSGGGGGGGGGRSEKLITVTPGNSYTVTVGARGVGASDADGQNGGDSWFISSGTVLAKGGHGGLKGVGNAGGPGGSGGSSGAGIGDTKTSGGAGGTGRSNGSGGGGGGGGSGGSSANGGVGGTGTAGAGGGGGGGGDGGATGGDGGTFPSVGGAGFAPGGGGGGSTGTGVSDFRAGGDGGGGAVTLTWAVSESIVETVSTCAVIAPSSPAP